MERSGRITYPKDDDWQGLEQQNQARPRTGAQTTTTASVASSDHSRDRHVQNVRGNGALGIHAVAEPGLHIGTADKANEAKTGRLQKEQTFSYTKEMWYPDGKREYPAGIPKWRKLEINLILQAGRHYRTKARNGQRQLALELPCMSA